MPGSLSPARFDGRESQRRIRRPGAPCFKFTRVTALAALSLTVALSSARSKPVRAEDALQAGLSGQAATQGGRSGSAAQIQRTLKQQHDRMIDLAKQLIGRDDELGHLWNQKINQDITVESGKANFSNAVLTREVAEIAVLEYEQGIFIQDKATVQGEIVLANSDLKRAPQAVELWKGRLADIKKASKGSAADLATEFAFADRAGIAERQVGKAELANQQAESKLKILLEYTKSRRVKELQSELEKARSAELENRATWEFAKSKAKRLEEAIKMHERSARERRAQDLLDRQALAALDSAIPIEAQLRTKLEQLKKNEKRDDSLEKETKDLANQLEALVDRAGAKRAAARFDALKTTIHSAAGRFPGSARSRPVRLEGGFEAGPNAQAPNPGDQSGFAAEIQRSLTKQHDQMINLATQLVGTAEAPEKLDDHLAIQQITIESAKAKLDQAVLNREVAEIALVEFEKGTFLLDKATAEAELKMARAELERARQNIEPAKDRFARIQKASKGSTSDIANEITYGDGVWIAQLELSKGQFAVEQAEAKLRVLLEFTKPQRTKKLRSEVENAQSDVLARKATWQLEQAKLKKMQTAVKEQNLPPRERKARDLVDGQALASLDRAIPIEEQLRTKLEEFTKNGKRDDSLQKEIRDLSNQLQALIDQADAERSAAQYDKLKAKIHAAPQ